MGESPFAGTGVGCGAPNNRYKLGMLVRHRAPFIVTGRVLSRGPSPVQTGPVQHLTVVSCTPDP